MYILHAVTLLNWIMVNHSPTRWVGDRNNEYLACKNKQIKITLFMYRKKSQITTRYENNIHLLHILIKLHFTDL